MAFSLLAIVLGSIIIQQYADATFVPAFRHPGHPIKPHFHGPLMLGPLPMPGPHLMPHNMMPAPHFPVPPPKFFKHHMRPHNSQYMPNMFQPSPKLVPKMPPKFVRQMPSKYPQKSKPLNGIRKKPGRVNVIKRKNIRPFHRKANPYGYGRRVTPRQSLNNEQNFPREIGLNYDNIYQRYRYNDNNNLPNNYRGRGRDQKRRRPGVPVFNNGAFNHIKVERNNNNDFRRNWNEPHLREVIDSSNRIQIRKNSLEARNVGSVRRTSVGKRRNNRNGNTKLSGKTIDFTGSQAISSSKRFGNNQQSSNSLDKNNANIQLEKSSIKRNRMGGNRKRVNLSNSNIQSGFQKGKKLGPVPDAPLHLGGSFIDLSNVRQEHEGNNPGHDFFSSISVSNSVTSDSKSSIKGSSESSVLSTFSTSASLTDNSQNPANFIGASDLVIGSAGTSTTGLTGTPNANDALTNVVDLTAINGGRANFGDFRSLTNAPGTSLVDTGAFSSNQGTGPGDVGTLSRNRGSTFGDTKALPSTKGAAHGDFGALSNNAGVNFGDIGALSNKGLTSFRDSGALSNNQGNSLGGTGALVNNQGTSRGTIGAISKNQKSDLGDIRALSNNLGSSLDSIGAWSDNQGSGLSDTGALSNNQGSALGDIRVMSNNQGSSLGSIGTWSNNQGSGLSDIGALSNNQGSALGDIGAMSNNQGSSLGSIGTWSNNQGSGLSGIGALSNNQGSALGDIGTMSNNQGTGLGDFGSLSNNPGTGLGHIGALKNVPGASLGDLAALSNVIDLTSVTDGIPGADIGDTGAFDVLTLDKSAFSQLEQALQTGQTVDATLLDSIIGAGGGVAGGGNPVGLPNGGAGSTGLATGGGVADLGIADAVAPQIYLLDGTQAQQLTGSTRFAGSGGSGAHVVDSRLTSSTSSLSSQSSKTAKKTSSHTHAVTNIPHAEKVIPGGHGHSMPGGHTHDIVGVVGEPVGSFTVGANTDIMGLFSMPKGQLQNIPSSVASIPKSIGQRMAHTGGHGMHAGH